MRPVMLFAVVMAIASLPKTGSSGELPVAPSADFAGLFEAIREARDDWHVPTDAELAEAKTAALAAHERLIARLADLPDGLSIGDELGLPELLNELNRETPDQTALERADWTLHRNRPGAKGNEYDELRGSGKVSSPRASGADRRSCRAVRHANGSAGNGMHALCSRSLGRKLDCCRQSGRTGCWTMDRLAIWFGKCATMPSTRTTACVSQPRSSTGLSRSR